MNGLVEWAHVQHTQTTSAKIVLMLLAACADEQGRVCMRIKDIARICELSRSSVYRALRDLRFNRLIAKRGDEQQVSVIEILYREGKP